MARFVLLSFCLVLMCVTPLRASESDELREKAKSILREAATLAEKGHKDEAEQLQAKAKELLQAAEQRDREQKSADKERRQEDQGPLLENLERHLKDLLTKAQQAKESNASKEDLGELQKHIAATKGKIDEIRSQQKRGPDTGRGGPGQEMKMKLAEAMERIQHLRVAAEHLRAAGAAELSQKVTEQAEQMEREARQMKEHLMREMAEHDGGHPGQVEELRREVQRLRAEVEELRKQKTEK